MPVLSGLLLVGIFMFSLTKGLDYGLKTATAFLPFGASAAFLLGGQSVLTTTLCFFLLLGLWGVTIVVGKNQKIRLELPILIILALCTYALLVTLIGPRLFQGDIMVFSLDRNVIGYRLRHDIPSGLSPLMPTKSNISQLIYFMVTFAVFVLGVALCRKKGPEVIHKGLIWAGILNIGLGTLDLIGADAILKLFQTASYGYLTDVMVLGRERITGAFPEASSFGGFCIVLAGYFLRLFVSTGDKKVGMIGLGNFAFGALSVSSTFIVSTSVTLAYVFTHLAIHLLRGRGVSSHSKQFVFVALLGASSFVFLLAFSPLGAGLFEAIDYLIFDKADSLSGYERGYWAVRGLQVGLESYGFGIGLGSTRSNGLISVWLSSFGFLGTFLFLSLYRILLFSKQSAFERPAHKHFFDAACVGLVANLAGALTSATIPDPGLLFALLAALSVASRKPTVVVYGRDKSSSLKERDRGNAIP